MVISIFGLLLKNIYCGSVISNNWWEYKELSFTLSGIYYFNANTNEEIC